MPVIFSDPFKDTGMTKERYREIEEEGLSITTEEWCNGWFFSDEFDGMLVHKSWPEGQFD